ncbi:ROK family protein [Reyranella sp.]|uniref:ROK family protein n=1 Tax=Reyranella sp. TaxID=1929291 RepID=UPI003D09628B
MKEIGVCGEHAGRPDRREPLAERSPSGANGLRVLPQVIVDTYNEELRDEEGFVGDRASGRAFGAILDDWRERVAASLDEDPFGDTPTGRIARPTLDKVLTGTDTVAAGLVHTAIEEFAHELATVVRRFLRLEGWRHTERIVIGGGLSSSHIGQLATGRAQVLLAGEGASLELVPIGNHPDEAGLIGAAQLAPPGILADHEAILAADIGGTNLRVGIVELDGKNAGSKATVWKMQHWCHRDDKPTRDEAVRHLAEMTTKLIQRSVEAKLALAPFMGIGCPGLIDERGAILNGGQNLPGNWQEDGFNLATTLAERLPRIDAHVPAVVIHNDAVVQGLSEVPRMKDVARWGVLTIGTGLGNARFTNRPHA